MSQLKIKGKPLADKRNVLSVFSKHYKSQKVSTSVPISNATACCSSCSHVDAPIKEKRMKTRKQRDHRRQRCGRQNIKLHSRSKQSCSEKLSQGSCQPPSCSHNRDKFAKAFGPKEPSFITERRLIGHQGLFNHEVKSFDIERLLSEERRAERSKTQRNKPKEILFSPTPSPAQNSGSDRKCPSNHKNEVSKMCNRQGVIPEIECVNVFRSQISSQTDDSCADSQGPRPILCQKKTEDMDQSLSDGTSVVVLLSSPKNTQSNNMQLTPRNSVEEFSSPKMHCAECHIQPVTFHTNNQHSEFTPASLNPSASYPKIPSSPPDSPPAKDISCASRDQKAKSSTESAKMEAKTAKHLISLVADRLCKSLDRPPLLRRHLVAESRANLLHVLQERHGTLLQQNLLKLQTRLGLGQSKGDGRHSEGSDDTWTAIESVQGSGSKPDPVLQAWLGPQLKTRTHRRRKQRCPQRRTPSSPPPSHGLLSESLQNSVPRKRQGLPWTPNMGTEKEVHPFPLGLPLTDAVLTDDIFSSKWGLHTGSPQSWDKPHRQQETHPQELSNWNHDPDLRITCQTGCVGSYKHPFSIYRNPPLDGDLRERQFLTVDKQFDPVAAFCPEHGHSSLSFQHQPYYRFHHSLPSASSSIVSYRPDISFYPPSELLDMAVSPPEHPSASPESWSYPRMRLY